MIHAIPVTHGRRTVDPIAGDRFPLVVTGIAVALLPLLNPKGPVNSASVDVVVAASIMTVGLWAGTLGVRIRAPYAVASGCLAVTGLIAALGGIAPAVGLDAIAQEAFLFLWCVSLTTLCRTPESFRFVTRVFCLSAGAWAGVVVATVALGVDVVPGGNGGEGDRVRLWFDQPNMAGNYFMLAFFMVLATRQPRRPAARVAIATLLVVAVLLTGSISALSCLPAGALVIVVMRVHRRSGLIGGVTVGLGLLLAGLAIWSVVATPVNDAIRSSDSSVVQTSVGRASRSASGRESLFDSQYDVFRDGDLLGIGPAATPKVLAERGAAVAKTPHNDFLATLVERGPLGAIALIGLMGAIAVRIANAQHLPPDWRVVVPEPAALVALAVGFAITAITHEVLHYRHFWMFLAFVAALHIAALRDSRASNRPSTPDAVAARPQGQRQLVAGRPR